MPVDDDEGVPRAADLVVFLGADVDAADAVWTAAFAQHLEASRVPVVEPLRDLGNPLVDLSEDGLILSFESCPVPVGRDTHQSRGNSEPAERSLQAGEGPDQQVEDAHLREPVSAAGELSLELLQNRAVAIKVSFVAADERGGALPERP
jgi:hypothetical protein